MATGMEEPFISFLIRSCYYSSCVEKREDTYYRAALILYIIISIPNQSLSPMGVPVGAFR